MNIDSKWICFLFPIPSIVFLVIMGILLKFSTLDKIPITFSEWLLLMLIVFIFFILPFDIIRWFLWGKRKYLQRLSKKLGIQNEAILLVDKVYSLVNIINTTIDRNEFELAISNLKHTLEQLISYEKFDIFDDTSPSQDLSNLLKQEAELRIELENRIKNNIAINTSSATLINSNYDSMEGHDFEYFCADLLKKNGFINVKVTQSSGDHGIDILAEKDDITYAIQCKCYSSNIGNAAVQQAHTGKSLYHRDVAVVMTNQYFTQQAKEEATQLGVKLWNRDRINEMIEKSLS